jgi:hypothetical protein
MIDDLLAAARLQTGRAQAVTLDLAVLVDAKAAEFEPVASEKNLVVASVVSPTVVQGVEVSLDRALSNLLENAHRAAPVGSTIVVGCGVREGWAWLGVEDQGPGLPDESGGARIGLGLSIVTLGGPLPRFPVGRMKEPPWWCGSLQRRREKFHRASRLLQTLNGRFRAHLMVDPYAGHRQEVR